MFDIFQRTKSFDLATGEFETAIEFLKCNRVAYIDNIKSNIILDVYDEIKDVSILVFKASLQ